jgi:hypothetical protein
MQYKVRLHLNLVIDKCAKFIFIAYIKLVFLHKHFVLHKLLIGENYDKRRGFAESKRLL